MIIRKHHVHRYCFKLGDFLFTLGLFLYILGKTLEISTISYQIGISIYLMRILRYSAYALILIKIITVDRFSKRELLMVMFIYSILAVISLKSNNRTLLFNCLFWVASIKMNIRYVLKISTYSLLISCCSVLAMFYIGFLPDWIYIQGERERHSLGFCYPSGVSSIYFYIVIAWFMLRKEQSTIVELIVAEFINVVIYRLTDSRASFYGVMLCVIIMWCIRFRKKTLRFNRFTKLIYVYSVFIIAASCLVICFAYNESNLLMNEMNTLFNNRILMGHNALQQYKISLFGSDVTWVGYGGLGYTKMSLEGAYNFVDCSYVKLLFDYGLLFYVMILCGYSRCADKALHQGDRYLAMAILMICCYSMIEPRLIEFGFNPFVLSLSSLIAKRGSYTETKCKSDVNDVYMINSRV